MRSCNPIFSKESKHMLHEKAILENSRIIPFSHWIVWIYFLLTLLSTNKKWKEFLGDKNSPEIALSIEPIFSDKICIVKKFWHELNGRMCPDSILYSYALLSLLCNSFQELHAQSCSGDEKSWQQKTWQVLQSVQLCSQLTCSQPNANSFVRIPTTSVLTHPHTFTM